MTLFAMLPMYDWPEARAESDALWADMRSQLIAQGIAAPERLARRNGDLPPVPGGIRDAGGAVIAPDPATLDPDDFDLQAAWRHPDLLLGQTCWGPMEQGLSAHVRVVGQPDYSAFEGGTGAHYSSAIMTRDGAPATPPTDGRAVLPLAALEGVRFAFNGSDSMSGLIGIGRDLEAAGASLDIFSGRLETGSHRNSIRAVAEGRADACAVDCRTLALARRFEAAAVDRLTVVGWTAGRKGLPYISAAGAPRYALSGTVLAATP